MKPRLSILIGLIITVFFSIAFISQDDPLKVTLSKLEKFRTDYPQEKVHLHLDKPYYSIGDNIWFKAYVVNAETNQLSGLSKVLYVDLINETDVVTQSLRLPLAAGLSWGDFMLPDTLQEGNYRIRAYTTYMRNFDEGFFFDKTILIGNTVSNNIITTANYQFETQGTDQKVTTSINYSDSDGDPLIEKEVKYEVQLDSKTIDRGKAITDSQGNLQFSFVNNKPEVLKSGRINTVIKIDKDHSVPKNFPIKSTSNTTDVQFFPEGGNLVSSIRSKVAFKAIGADGLGKNTSGYISNDKGDKIASFKSERAGMGYFIMQPAAGQAYTATIKFPDGSEKQFPLPKAQPEGFVLGAVNSDSTNLFVKISASPAMLAAGGEVTLVAQSNSAVKFVSKNQLTSPILSSNIPKSRFPTGIVQLTLFDQQNRPVAERLVFINHHDFLKVSVDVPKTSDPRKKVKMDLDVKDPSGKPVLGSFSVSVTDAGKVPVNADDETTILSNLLLTSDIKGYVEQPNYYFNNTDAQKTRELDNLMLTQGWRRFSWTNILKDNFPPVSFKAEENGITISGRVTMNKKPVVGGKVILLSSKGGMFALDTLSDANGRFAFSNLVFPDSTRFVVQARSARGKSYLDITLDRIPELKVSRKGSLGEVEVNVNKKLAPFLKSSSNQFEMLKRYGMLEKGITLREVKITAWKDRPDKGFKGSANLAGRADAVITGEQLENCPTLASCLQGIVPGVFITNGWPFTFRHGRMSGMSVILDGVRLVDHDDFSLINPSDVAAVEILKGQTAAIYGTFGMGGVMVITTKLGLGIYDTYAPGLITYMPKAYYKSREFYAPNYDDPKTRKDIPDLRTTIYWKPNVAVKNGKASVEFFNTDSKGPYRVTIEGIDQNGKLARYVSSYTVN